MGQEKSLGFLIIVLLFVGSCARPGQLNQQIYEFQEYHSSSSQNHATSSASRNARIQAVADQHTLWSQRHPNEVNAFAEMFRLNYNHMVAQYNAMMRIQQQTMAAMFMPVNYELFHVPVGYTWNSYLGNQQQFVNEETERMSRQLIEDIEQGRRTQEELSNPNFFLEQAANELNRVHESNDFRESTNEQTVDYFENSHQQQRQQEQSVFIEPVQQTELEQHAGHAVVYNAKTNQYEYVDLQQSPESAANEDHAGSANTQYSSNIQSLSPVTFDNEKLNTFNQQIAQIEIHTPISIETPRPVQESLSELVVQSTEPLAYQSTRISNDDFYGSTYDQQQNFDLQFVENRSVTPRNNVMSLVRNRTKAPVLTTTEIPTTAPTTSTTTSTTTALPTTTSGIMSMLPHKKPPMNYADLYQQVRTEMDKHLKNMDDNKAEEIHFMGMTSNRDHVKLTYESINQRKDETEPRGDQGHPADDYIYDGPVEMEPGMGYYSVGSEPTVVQQTATTTATSTPPRTTSTIYTTTASPPTTVDSNYLISYYSAPLAPFPTTTTTLRPLNPYYSAPLAPFPEEMVQEVSNTHQQLQYAEYSEIFDMNQEVQTIDPQYENHFVEADTIQDVNNQEEYNQNQFQLTHGYTDMQQFEDEQQRYTDVRDEGKTLQHPDSQKYEKQLPPEQAYRNPDLQYMPANDMHQEYEEPAHVQEIVVTPTPTNVQHHKKNWFQRQFDKIKNVLR